MNQKYIYGLLVSVLILVLVALPVGRAENPVLDEVNTRIDQGMAEVRINLTLPVRPMSHFPENHGELLRIYFQIVGVAGENISLREETRRVAATATLPGFSVTYAPPASENLTRDPPSLLIQFDKPVSFTVGTGDNNQGISVYIPVTPSRPSNK